MGYRSRRSRRRRSAARRIAGAFTGTAVRRSGAAGAFLVAGGLLFNALAPGQASSVTAAAGRMFRDPEHFFNLRSPGHRQAGALSQSKQRLAAADQPRPHERVLSVVRERPTPLGDLLVPDPITGPLFFAESAPFLSSPASIPTGDASLPHALFLPASSGWAPGASPVLLIGPESDNGGGDGPGGNEGGSPVTPGDEGSIPASVIGAVPEPDTWAMMIAGLFATAHAMRRGRRSARHEVAN